MQTSPHSVESKILQADPSRLVQVLSSLEQEGFSGTLKVTTVNVGTSKRITCFLVFQQGYLTIVERKLPSPDELLVLLGHRLKIKVMDLITTYKTQTTSRISVRDLLGSLITTKAISWDDIERVMRQRMVILIEQLLPHSCNVEKIPDVKLDLAYGRDKHGIRYTDILQQIEQRQPAWKPYLSVLPSVEVIPEVRTERLAQIKHEATRNHLQKWVNGETTLAEIAETLDQDPLTLAPLYTRWFQEGLITFKLDTEPEAQALPVVLSVDDSPIVQALIRRVLSERYEVLSAKSAIEAMGILSNRDVALILLDVTMPDIDGLEFCRTLRKIDKFKALPVIMLTAKDSKVDRAMGLLAGTSRYLTKPVDQNELLTTVSEFLDTCA